MKAHGSAVRGHRPQPLSPGDGLDDWSASSLPLSRMTIRPWSR